MSDTYSVVCYSTLFPVQQAEMPADVLVAYAAFINTTDTTQC